MEFSLTTKDGNLAIRFKDKENRHNNKIVSLSNTNGALVEIGDDESLSSIENTKTVDEISTEITIALASFNLPIQIDIQKINSGGYNTYLRNSDVLFSNTANAKIIDNWFITEYFDEDGVAKSAIPPVAVKEEVKQVTRPIQEGSNSGVRVDDNTIVSNGDIINDKGEDITDNKTPEEYNKIEETAEEILRKPLDPNNEANKHAVSSLDVMRRVVKRPIVKSKPTKSVSLPTLGEQTKSVNQLEKPNKTFNFEDLDSELRTILSLNELDIERDAVIGKEFNRKEFNNLPIEEKVKIIYQARNSVLELRNVYESEFGKGMKMTSEFISKNLPELSERHKKMWEKLSQTEKQHEIKCLGY